MLPENIPSCVCATKTTIKIRIETKMHRVEFKNLQISGTATEVGWRFRNAFANPMSTSATRRSNSKSLFLGLGAVDELTEPASAGCGDQHAAVFDSLSSLFF